MYKICVLRAAKNMVFYISNLHYLMKVAVWHPRFWKINTKPKLYTITPLVSKNILVHFNTLLLTRLTQINH